MNNLNVLLVTYVFPPAGGTGVMRATSLARYFPAEQIRLDVLTARNASSVGSDPTLLKDIPDQVTVHRTIALDLPFGFKKRIKRLITGGKPSKDRAAASSASADNPSFLKKLIGGILQPDPQVTWLPVAIRAARRIVRDRKIDLVLITVPPFSSALLVEKLRRDFPELPIVVDFRDEWLSTGIDLVGFGRSPRAFRIARKAEARAINDATAIVAVTEGARREIRARHPELPDSKFQLISNGYDSTRLLRSTLSPISPHNDKIIVTYVGTIYSATEPGTLIQAIQSLPPEIRSKFKLRFIGHIQETHFREDLLQLGDMVELLGYLPQHEALAAMNQTDYVLLLNHDHLNVGGKFYDYIGSGKPILGALHPDGDTCRLFAEMRAGWWAPIHDVEGIRRLFIDAAARGNSLAAEFQPDREKIAQYDRKVLAQRYARLLHSIAAGGHEVATTKPAETTQKSC
ncbi:MAG: glycosyltransferase [Terracidiphilus sp.]|jgi:hypothetical protein